MLTATTDPRELLGTDDTRYLIVATLTRLRHLPVVRNRWEDVLQEAYLALAQALPQFDPARSCWATFLATVITNHVRDLCWRWLPPSRCATCSTWTAGARTISTLGGC